MSAVICVICLICACLVLALGLVRISSWVIDRREEQGAKAIRDAMRVAQARAEFLPTPSQIRHADLEYATALLDQQDMGEGWS